MSSSDYDESVAAIPEGEGVPFEEALGSLIREAEREGVDVAVPRDFDAVESGAWAVEITKVEFDREG